ncbi:MAG: PEGA domain-containing protein [Myxococcales bacterium]|nr:PEGA domain-containing protein [Myxococcales bacterium]
MARRQLSGVVALLVVLLCASVALAKPRRKRGRGKVQASSTEAQAEKPAPLPPDPYAGIPASRLLEAKRRFLEAVQLEQDGNHEAAIVEFEASYELVPRPNTLYNLGLVHEKLFRYDQAISYYALYLKRAPKDDPDRDAVMLAKERLQNLLGQVHIKVSPQADVWLDGRRLGQAPGTFFIPAGRHVLELRKDGYLPARRQLTVASRREHDLSVTLKSAKDEPPLHPAFFWTGVGLTVATAAVGTYFGIRTLSLNSDLEESDPLLPSTQTLQEDKDQAALLTDIFFISSAGLALTTVVLAIFTDWDGDEDDDASTSKDSAAWLPFVGPYTAGIQYRGAL